MTKAREKLKISFDIKTFLVIITTIGSISFWGATLANKIDTVVVVQQETKEQIKDIYACQKKADERFAWLEPTVQMILKKIWL